MREYFSHSAAPSLVCPCPYRLDSKYRRIPTRGAERSMYRIKSCCESPGGIGQKHHRASSLDLVEVQARTTAAWGGGQAVDGSSASMSRPGAPPSPGCRGSAARGRSSSMALPSCRIPHWPREGRRSGRTGPGLPIRSTAAAGDGPQPFGVSPQPLERVPQGREIGRGALGDGPAVMESLPRLNSYNRGSLTPKFAAQPLTGDGIIRPRDGLQPESHRRARFWLSVEPPVTWWGTPSACGPRHTQSGSWFCT